MGSGKSTFIKENNLKQYTLCPDDIRLLFQSPVMNINGSYSISQKNDKQVWGFLFDLLEKRMKRGELTIIDAVHATKESIHAYKKLADKYRYRVWIIDFTDVPIEVAKERNRRRPSHKIVPENVIDNAYARFDTQILSNWAKVIKPNDFSKALISSLDFSNYKKIHHIGDIHGCFTALSEYLKEGIKDDELYIFIGDYLDRGVECKETLEFLFSIMNKNNVLFLEGNHEKYLREYASDKRTKNSFAKNTLPQIQDISKSEIRRFCRKLIQIAYYTYNEKVVLVTHGGISKLDINPLFIATEQFINGVGKYEDDIDSIWNKNMPDDFYQIHGHRNLYELPITASNNSFNLEGSIEFGGHLRVLTLDNNGFKEIKIKNNIFHNIKQTNNRIVNDNNIIGLMRDNKGVIENKQGNISSFNFSKRVFRNRLWDNINVRARGLFINNNTGEIVARGYNKFFNINEGESNRLENLRLVFPIKCYVKENGYLGLLGYDSETDELIFASKSSITSKHAQWFKNVFYNKVTLEQAEQIKQYLKVNNKCFIFEVIDIKNDPHIIKYHENNIILLDVIERTIESKMLPYNELIKTGVKYGLPIKENPCVLNSQAAFLKWIKYVNRIDYLYDGEPIEGYVIVDSTGFMLKIKLPFYKLWKNMRGVKEKLKSDNPQIDTRQFTTLCENYFYGWLREQPDEMLCQDIITLRDRFIEEYPEFNILNG